MTDRDKVIKGLENTAGYFRHLQSVGFFGDQPVYREHEENCNNAIAFLKEQEPEAKWIYGEDETGVDGWHCSECNFFEPWFYEFTEDIDFIRFYGHCPKCGRRMTSYTGKPTQERR